MHMGVFGETQFANISSYMYMYTLVYYTEVINMCTCIAKQTRLHIHELVGHRASICHIRRSARQNLGPIIIIIINYYYYAIKIH